MKKLIFCVGIVALPMTAFAASPVVKPGEWKITTQTEMPGAPMQIPPTTISICITKEDAEKPEASLPKGRGDCKMLDYKLEGNKASWKMDCTSPHGGKISGTGNVTYSSESYEGSMHMKITSPRGEQEILTKFEGKRVSESCTK